MPKRTITINSILGGISPTLYLSGENQYLDSLGVDPDYTVNDSDISAVKTAGILIPTRYSDFTSTAHNSVAKWIVTNPKDTKIYTLLANGKFNSYTSSFGSETTVATAATCDGNGMAYYNNYIYVFRNTDIDRYGPLDGTPSYTTGVWTGATLGTQTALTNTTYPTFNSVEVPNHPAHFHHPDNRLYFGDVVNGQGVIHSIETKKVTDQGDTNDGSAFNVLDLPFGYLPTDIESYGGDLVISAIQTTDATITQGKAALFFWDTISDRFHNQVTLPDPLVTSLLNNNGKLYIWTGNNSSGHRVSVYAGGDSIQQVSFLEEGVPPYAGAIDAFGDRVSWGSNKSTPSTASCVYALGSKISGLSSGLHNIVVTSNSGANPGVYALKYVQQSSNKEPKVVASWKDDSDQGIDKEDTSATFKAKWRSQLYNIGRQFIIKEIRLPLAKAVAANMTVTPKIFVDDASDSASQTVINNTNFASSERFVRLFPNVHGNNNFFLEIAWTGTVLLPLSVPITIDFEFFDK